MTFDFQSTVFCGYLNVYLDGKENKCNLNIQFLDLPPSIKLLKLISRNLS